VVKWKPLIVGAVKCLYIDPLEAYTTADLVILVLVTAHCLLFSNNPVDAKGVLTHQLHHSRGLSAHLGSEGGGSLISGIGGIHKKSAS